MGCITYTTSQAQVHACLSSFIPPATEKVHGLALLPDPAGKQRLPSSHFD